MTAVIKTIHTLNARGNVMLEVMRDYFSITPARMFREIQGMRQMVETQLAAKGVSYDSLRSALVPDRKRREIALVFDNSIIKNGWYGYEVFERVIPLFDKGSNHSILVGDYLPRDGQADLLFEAFRDAVRPVRPVEYRHPTQFYIVYINNLTEAMVQRFADGLGGYEPYVGMADTTFLSPFKILLSTMLVNLGVKHGRIMIQGHEPDRDENEDVNMSGLPFEENGYICRSLSSDLEGVLLSYKIERPIFPGFEVDTEFSLNAISGSPLPLGDFKVEVTEAKLAYIKEAKAGSAERAGLEALSPGQLEAMIQDRINGSYIYNLSAAEGGVIKFNIILELRGKVDQDPTRLLAALEYKADEKILRLITLF
jgi:hypothetical protein